MKGLRIKNITSSTFNKLSFDFPATGLYGLIGKNGVGKSTLFTIINGETEIKQNEKYLSVGGVAYIPDLNIFDKNLSANDYLKLLSSSERTTFESSLKLMGGSDFLSRRISSYSLGMKELFALLYLLSLQREVVILDELIDGLDEQKRFKAYDLLKKHSRNKLILLTSHNLSEVFENCDRVYLLKESSLVEVGSLSEAHSIIN
ncbi:ATP-binding cassette domain-containing protein [Streptococcus loxodontisalivarius]|uniref:ABC-2 type transport system ATP-binding protein n=1 Tax=Streptococcus loxodontisalivarius TaxID=1349415 RepID=A0ABS2PPS2_9STRE|nr:ATP-binding cassette domain-containing protein [Streptococcus loxodontisalivarius]MBM7641948.1 ABC-2 type transport system ATP-binding protein [Streptococcus loxodontisalivarius]